MLDSPFLYNKLDEMARELLLWLLSFRSPSPVLSTDVEPCNGFLLGEDDVEDAISIEELVLLLTGVCATSSNMDSSDENRSYGDD